MNVRNGSGYYDPTAADALASVRQEEKAKNRENRTPSDERRVKKLMAAIFNICELAGFHLEDRIVLKDKVTGKIWK